jgi:hypothetical protein
MLGEEYDNEEEDGPRTVLEPVVESPRPTEEEREAFSIPEGALAKPELTQAYYVVQNLPMLDYVFYILCKTVLYLYHDINGPAVSDGSGHCAPDIQQIISVASQHGRLAFVWSVEALITKSKIVKATLELVLGLFNGSSPFYAANQKVCDLVATATDALKVVAFPLTHKHHSTRVILQITTLGGSGDDGVVLRKFNIKKSTLKIYEAYWTLHHPADMYIEQGKTTSKALDQHELIRLWNRVFTVEMSARMGVVLKAALITLLDTMLE